MYRTQDANSKLLDFVSIADSDAEERVDDSLVEILKLKLGKDICQMNFSQVIEAEVWSRF